MIDWVKIAQNPIQNGTGDAARKRLQWAKHEELRIKWASSYTLESFALKANMVTSKGKANQTAKTWDAHFSSIYGNRFSNWRTNKRKLLRKKWNPGNTPYVSKKVEIGGRG